MRQMSYFEGRKIVVPFTERVYNAHIQDLKELLETTKGDNLELIKERLTRVNGLWNRVNKDEKGGE